MHNTHSKGETAQLKVELRAIEKGLIVSKPTRHETRYDCIVDDNGKLLRAQIKYTAACDKRTNGSVRVELRKFHKNNVLHYNSKDIDILLVYLPRVERVLCFGPEFFERDCFQIRVERPVRNISPDKYHWYEDFIW